MDFGRASFEENERVDLTDFSPSNANLTDKTKHGLNPTIFLTN